MTVAKKILGESVIYLQRLIRNKRRLNYYRVKESEILELIKKKQADNRKFAEEIISSPLCELACVNVIRKGKAEKIKIKGEYKYRVKAREIITQMIEIVDKANFQGQSKQVRNYIRGTK